MNGHFTNVVYGDNAPYADHITAHNRATDASREWVSRLIPIAEKTGVVIALENVRNNMWVTPATFRHFVASFRSPWVKAYYDIGNHVRFAPPEQWVLTLGELLVKVHVKDARSHPRGQRTLASRATGAGVHRLQRLVDHREQSRHFVRRAASPPRPDSRWQVTPRDPEVAAPRDRISRATASMATSQRARRQLPAAAAGNHCSLLSSVQACRVRQSPDPSSRVADDEVRPRQGSTLR